MSEEDMKPSNGIFRKYEKYWFALIIISGQRTFSKGRGQIIHRRRCNI